MADDNQGHLQHTVLVQLAIKNAESHHLPALPCRSSQARNQATRASLWLWELSLGGGDGF